MIVLHDNYILNPLNFRLGKKTILTLKFVDFLIFKATYLHFE